MLKMSRLDFQPSIDSKHHPHVLSQFIQEYEQG